MKKFIAIVFILCVAGASLTAFEIDFSSYPVCMAPNNLMLNIGVGFGGNFGVKLSNWGPDYINILPIHLAVDYNLALGGLPFFLGGFVDNEGHGCKGKEYTKYYYHTIGFGLRIGYHFNFVGMENVDAYALLKAGWSFYLGDNEYVKPDLKEPRTNWPVLGLNVGGRIFLMETLGIWAELGIGSYFSLGAGLTIKF